MARPLLGIVVPFYDAAPFLANCLASIRRQSVRDIQVVLVDDGSADGGAEIAQAVTAEDGRFTLIRTEHAGPGRARNIGLAAVTADHLAFVDGDDEVAPDGFERLLASLAASRSDIASGRVTRFNTTKNYPSALHTKALPTARARTHISREQNLLYDVTMWNKVFRSDFWRHHDFRFPEGVLYEDVVLATETHVHALAVDVIGSVVYRWRERDDGVLSITQRRGEINNLRDRVAALTRISQFLAVHGPKHLCTPHDKKALADLALYFPEIIDAQDDYLRAFLDLVGGYLRTSSRQALQGLDPALRLKYSLVRKGEPDMLRELLHYEQDHSGLPVRRKGRRMTLVVPPTVAEAVPRNELDMSRRLPMLVGVESITWERNHLVLLGFAAIRSVPLQSPAAAVRRLVFTERHGSRRLVTWLLPRRRPQRTAADGQPNLGYDWCGFRAQIPMHRLAPTGDQTSTNWDVTVQVLTPVAARGATLGPARSGTAWIPPIGRVGDLMVVASWRDRQHLQLAASTTQAELTGATIGDGRVHLTFRISPGDLADPFAVQIPMSDAQITVPAKRVSMDHAGTVVEADVPLKRLTDAPGDHTELPVYVVANGRPWAAVTGFVGEVAATVVNREILVRRGLDGMARIVVRQPWVVVHTASWDGRWLTFNGRMATPAGVPVPVFLSGPDDSRIAGRTTRTGEEFRTQFDLTAVPGSGGTRCVRPGRWRLMRSGPGIDEPDRAIPASTGAAAAIECAKSSTQLIFDTWVDRIRAVTVVVHTLPADERGGYHQERLRSRDYRRHRQRPLADLVLFESWQGKQFSDNPRAVFEELRRRDDSPPLVWVVRDRAVPVPQGIRTVVRGSREYWQALGTARWLVANDSTTPHYRKRPGQVYLQTWHGTPLKRIGFDIEAVHFRNKNYLQDLAVEVAKWDFLISPDPTSTDILRNAFRFAGKMLATGYPRNDVLRAPAADAIRLHVRTELGIKPDARVVLWAPTWRDHHFDRSGRYFLSVNDDIRRLANVLGETGGVLLFRGHHLVKSSIGADQAAVRNVSDYPDIAYLYLAADALLTDYSSAMFDFAVLDRPIIVYAWDLAEYRDEIRGFYVNIENVAPSPVLTDLEDVLEAMHDLAGFAVDNRGRHERFTSRYCQLSDGNAAARVVDAVFRTSQ